MTTRLTEEQVMIQDMAKRFAADRLGPHTSDWDKNKHFPVDVIRDSAELGFAGIYVGEDVGGSALGRLDAALIFEQLSYGDVSTAAFISIHNMASWMIDRFGSELCSLRASNANVAHKGSNCTNVFLLTALRYGFEKSNCQASCRACNGRNVCNAIRYFVFFRR